MYESYTRFITPRKTYILYEERILKKYIYKTSMYAYYVFNMGVAHTYITHTNYKRKVNCKFYFG